MATASIAKMVLISGASGTVGARLAQQLSQRGERIRALVLPDDPLRHRLADLGCQLVTGDITDAPSLAAAMSGIRTVFHLAAVVLSHSPRVFHQVNVEGTRNMLAAAKGAGVEHFIYVSSASVLYPCTTPYSRSKRACEQLVSSETEMSWTVVRPTLVYESDGGQEFRLFCKFVETMPVVALIDGGHARKSPVHVDDLIAGLAAIAGNQQTHGKTYNLSGGEDLTLREMAELLLAHQGRRKRFVDIPLPLARAIGAVAGTLSGKMPFVLHTVAGLSQDAVADRSAAIRDLGYAPIGFRQGLKERVALG